MRHPLRSLSRRQDGAELLESGLRRLLPGFRPAPCARHFGLGRSDEVWVGSGSLAAVLQVKVSLNPLDTVARFGSERLPQAFDRIVVVSSYDLREMLPKGWGLLQRNSSGFSVITSHGGWLEPTENARLLNALPRDALADLAGQHGLPSGPLRDRRRLAAELQREVPFTVLRGDAIQALDDPRNAFCFTVS